jgi:hypothetical protein
VYHSTVLARLPRSELGNQEPNKLPKEVTVFDLKFKLLVTKVKKLPNNEHIDWNPQIDSLALGDALQLLAYQLSRKGRK